jgi:histidine ammonia-lyase
LSAAPVRLRLAHLAGDLAASLAELRRDPARVVASRARVEAALVDGNAYYGINTGFGILASQRISRDQLAQLQHNLILSHAVGVGVPVPIEITRLMLRLKIHALGLGYSGVSLGTFERLLAFDELGLVPVVPSRGSLGASGDLAPLAHLALPLLGRGRVWDAAGRDGEPASGALARCGLEPIGLEAKDGLALINGTQMMSAYGAWALGRALELLRLVDVVAAMSLEALRGSARPFDARVHEVRPHPGQAAVAGNVRRLLEGSEILESHRFCGRVQDPYSLRCVPQVHGASRDALGHAADVIERELNSVTDNPLVFEDGSVISGGNFHGQPLALALDYAAIALAELGSISERRTYLLLGGHDGLPLLLMRETGVNSGFMIPQYTAAALVSENKVLCHPASVDSIPTSLGQEDHVSMGSISALKLLDVLSNVEQVIAIELFTAAQALDFRAPLRPGRGVEVAHAALRDEVPHRDADGDFEHDLGLCAEEVRRGALLAAVEGAIGRLA